MISPTMQIISENIPGIPLHDSRCLPCSGVSSRTIAVSFGSSQRKHRIHSMLNIGWTTRGSKESSHVCSAGSSGNRRNSDFSKQSKYGSSRNRFKKDEDRDDFDGFEQSDLLSSKNGSLLPFSSLPRYQATAAPGPKEKEIVALFRKVQAQLRERAANKEEKKIEASQSQAKESETVDSLLKLLRKHSVKQGKKKTSATNSNNFVMDQEERNGSLDDGTSVGPHNASLTTRDEGLDINVSLLSRPASNFRRRSPVSRMKSQPIRSDKTTVNSINHKSPIDLMNPDELNGISEPEQESKTKLSDESEFNLDLDREQEPQLESILSAAGEFDETSDGFDAAEDGVVAGPVDHEDLSSLKVTELREIAKTRGVKGYSKMKKGDLLDLLRGSSI